MAQVKRSASKCKNKIEYKKIKLLSMPKIEITDSCKILF